MTMASIRPSIRVRDFCSGGILRDAPLLHFSAAIPPDNRWCLACGASIAAAAGIGLTRIHTVSVRSRDVKHPVMQ
jgi:hypothetical protein